MSGMNLFHPYVLQLCIPSSAMSLLSRPGSGYRRSRRSLLLLRLLRATYSAHRLTATMRYSSSQSTLHIHGVVVCMVRQPARCNKLNTAIKKKSNVIWIDFFKKGTK